MSLEGRRIEIRGVVQGVGFRPWVYRLAAASGVTGRVSNDTQGVTIEAFGDTRALDGFLRGLAGPRPPAASIDRLECTTIPAEPADAFVIVASQTADERRVSIPPDLATCPDCARDIADPANRRHGYAFTNCTNCGPRFTIARDVPYDRPRTTMAPFVMCPACAREYADVHDRRFHAQPNACPACGPRLAALTADGDPLDGDPLDVTVAAIRRGEIVAIKGLGGFHLACDARQSFAVHRLRQRKQRDEKPFAIMVPTPEAAEALAVLDPVERRLLASVERPIVLLRRREAVDLAPEIAPNNPMVGVMLPYTPLHHLLLQAVDGPVVMTSANLAEEPLAYRNDEALARLGDIADAFLVHDRDIETRCDDSVARVIAGAPVVLRRSRGYVPRAIPVATRFAQPILACGALLKNTFCIGVGDAAHLGPHIGDLENLETFESYEGSIDRTARFLRVDPQVVAHDLHPDYLSTRYALRRPASLRVPVQHHHAHVASAMAEHGLDGQVLGLAYDGTGLGTDGTAWGGELLVAGYDGFERLATFRPIALAGADTAIRQVWRIALAVVRDAFDGDAPIETLPIFTRVARQDRRLVEQMLAGRINTPLAHGAGRLFDAVGALVLSRTVSAYEGQIALEWNLAADPAERREYPYAIDTSVSPWQFDWRPMVRRLVEDMGARQPAGRIAAKFHNTVARASAEMVHAAAASYGHLPVVLTGGVFQNARLAESVHGLLHDTFRVHLHRDVPPGDGGLALGQAMVANAVLRAGARQRS